jgi:H+-transporting ATPase
MCGDGAKDAPVLRQAHRAVLCVVRERRHLWSSRPGRLLMASSGVDVAIVSLLAINGILMTPLSITILAGLFAAAIVFASLLDAVKVALFR